MLPFEKSKNISDVAIKRRNLIFFYLSYDGWPCFVWFHSDPLIKIK
jgi:hypothetical protein